LAGQAISPALGDACFELFADGLGQPAGTIAGETGASMSPVSAVTPVVPTPTAAPEPSYQTRKGSKTAVQLADELGAAGYAGPWEINAMLAAYDRASAPTPTPVPLTPRPVAPNYSGPCFQVGSTLSLDAINKIGLIGSTLSPQVIYDACLAHARQDGAQGVTCVQFAVRPEIDFVALAAAARLMTAVTAPSIDSFYAGCMGR
jgi:hypothetical protein